MLADTFKLCLKKYSYLYGNDNVVFHEAIIKYEKTKTGLQQLLGMIGAGNGNGFGIARTMDITTFCKYMENPDNKFIDRIKAGDISLVDELTRFGSRGNCFSAATKICTLWRESLERNHDCEPARPAPFVIADSFVRDALININRDHNFTGYNIKQVYKNHAYPAWHQIIIDFKNHFNLHEFTEREIDKSLWVLWDEFMNRPLLECTECIRRHLTNTINTAPVMRLITKVNGRQWDFHKSDKDPFPWPETKLHGHYKDIKLNPFTGELYNVRTKKFIGHISSKELDEVQDKLKSSKDFCTYFN